MAKRIKVGIDFTVDENWIGGAYYISNLVASLNSLNYSDKPEIIVFSWSLDDFKVIKKTRYPYLRFVHLSFPLNPLMRMLNSLSLFVSGTVLYPVRPGNKHCEIVFPDHHSGRYKDIPRRIYWIPDFQEIHYPGFFTEGQLLSRKRSHAATVNSGLPVVFSSKNALDDFRSLYPLAKNNTYTLNFAVTHPEFDSLDITALLTKYNIRKKYFIVPNQFWKHKNQEVILKAVLRMADRKDFQVVFTGNESDVRNPDYFMGLKDFVISKGLTDHVLFLGFIDRREQLKLMSNSISVIQPSLFEGWSTVVEDAKSMKKHIILSDIVVHHEQIVSNCSFFNPTDDQALAETMGEKLDSGHAAVVPSAYSDNIRKFAMDFISIIHSELK